MRGFINLATEGELYFDKIMGNLFTNYDANLDQTTLKKYVLGL